MTVPHYDPVTPEQAAEHCAVLLYELHEYDAARRVRAQEERGAAPLAYLGARPVSPARAVAGIIQLEEAEPVPVDLSDTVGLPPKARAALMARAKARAIDFAIAVRSRNAHQVQHLASVMTGAEWRALALVYAEVADPSRLLVVVQATDDGQPAHVEGRIHAA